jgi:beta-glucosidase
MDKQMMDSDVLQLNQVDEQSEARIERLLAEMTLAEKVGQLVQLAPFEMPDPDEFEALIQKAGEANASIQAVLPPRPGLTDDIRNGRIGSLLNLADAALVNRYQRIAAEESRLGIPLLVGSDVIHGFRTVFPIPLAEACTWDPPLLERAARVAAQEASAAGIDWIFAPMLDIGRDPRWGRVAEGAGEDPFLTAVMGEARVRGFQSGNLANGRRIAACPKHFVAYGAAEAGRDYNTVDISERTLRDVHLPPFKAAFDAGAGSVMSSFNEIGGVPVSANSFVLDMVLRQEWEWPGVVLSDFAAIGELVPHGVAADLKEAARLAILEGVDIDMMSGAYQQHLAELVTEGSVPQAVVDQSVRRMLRLKFGLGLFEQPYVDESLAAQVTLREESRALALQVAQQSMVLLKNENGLLPLAPGNQRLALIGPLAAARRDMLGTWTVFGKAADADTLLEGVQSYLEEDPALSYVPGCTLTGDEPIDELAMTAALKAADVVILALGEGHNLSGEARSRTALGLPGQQQALFDMAARAARPLVLVLMGGRPLVVPELVERADAVLMAWHGGIRAGQAIADLLFGAANPSGKLTASWPRSEGQIPVYYAHKSTGRPMAGEGTTQFEEAFKSGYIDSPNEPLFPFGYGLSYTTFDYRDLEVETPVIAATGTLVVRATLENTGPRAGTEVVQLYVRDLVGSVTRPVKELKGFQRLTLKPGEAQSVRFDLPVSALGFTGLDMVHRVEPGEFQVWIGPNAADGLGGHFMVK